MSINEIRGDPMSLNEMSKHVVDEIIETVNMDYQFSKMTYPVGKPLKSILSTWTGERLAVVSITDTTIEIALNPTIELPYHEKTLEYSIIRKVRDLYATENMRGVFAVTSNKDSDE